MSTWADQLEAYHFWSMRVANGRTRKGRTLRRHECCIRHNGHVYRASRATPDDAALAAIQKIRDAELRLRQ